jgi:hypothetical protein
VVSLLGKIHWNNNDHEDEERNSSELKARTLNFVG